MVSSNIYGSEEHDLEKVKSVIEDNLQIIFVAHNSSYRGGDYYRSGELNNEHFILQRNLDLIDNEPAEQDFLNYPIILYVEETGRSQEITASLGKIVPPLTLLRNEEY